MLRAQKEEFIEHMCQDVARASCILFLDFTGLSVAQADVFRQKVRSAGLVYRVVKNTLMTRVLKGMPCEAVSHCLKGTPTGVVLSYADPVAPAKLTFAHLQECEQLRVKGGIFDQKAMSASEAEALSKLPSQAELQARVVGLALGPGQRLVGQIKNPAGRMVGQIEELVKRMDQTDPTLGTTV